MDSTDPPKTPRKRSAVLGAPRSLGHLSDTGTRPILLQLDSGSGGPILYSGNRELQDSLLKQANLPEPEVCALRRAFAALPPQGVRIDTLLVQGVPFVTPAKAVEIGPEREEDGALATVLFQRVYFGNADHFVIFDPR